ncbi:MAG TPA: HD domain-containing phosphohydrolase [Symbiobacteriaceae bacterium]|nr:HD domain-containing phosphohydrolase [Symbiobacteriaceae bacterium]
MQWPDANEKVIWIACGVMLFAWALIATGWVGGGSSLLNDWANLQLGPEQVRVAIEMAALVFVAALLAWMFYALGLAELRKQAAKELEHRRSLEEAYQGTLQALTAALDLRDDETYGHSRRVSGYSLLIGRRMGLPETELQTLAWGALLHDLGKIGIRDDILLKPGPLTSEERAAMNEHVVIGHQLVESVPFLARTAAMVRHHHERYDGTGYPDRLTGEEIPILARIFTVADSFDAMTSPRPYRAHPRTFPEAIEIIRAGVGVQFCPRVVSEFLRVPVEEWERIRAESLGPVQEMDVLVGRSGGAPAEPQMSLHDPLTHTYNQVAWEAKAKRPAARGNALGTIVAVRPTGLGGARRMHGQAAVDRILADLGTRLRQVGLEVYRLDGDQFFLWFPAQEWGEESDRRLEVVLGYFCQYWCHLSRDLAVNWGVAGATDATRDLAELAEQAVAYGRERKAGCSGLAGA